MPEPVPFPYRTTAILRGVDPSDVVDLATRAWGAGFELVEVPVQTPMSWRALEALVARASGGAIGAGTVTSVGDVMRAASVGVQALVSPGVDREVSTAALEHDVPLLPGVMTPSEVMQAFALGHREVKLFPAGELGPSYLSALRGPFPEARIVVVGGVGPHAVRDFVAAGAWGLGVGGDLEAFVAEPSILAPFRGPAPQTPMPPDRDGETQEELNG